MEWNVLFCDEDQSYVLVEKKAIVSAGDVSKRSLQLEDYVTVIYNRKPYRGQIKAMSGAYFPRFFQQHKWLITFQNILRAQLYGVQDSSSERSFCIVMMNIQK